VLGRIVELAAPAPNWRVLDVATGTGHTAFALSSRVASVVAIDLTEEMLTVARAEADRRGTRNITFETGDVHNLRYGSGTFDLVTCRRAAHHFSDLPRALAEMRRVLVAGGRLIIDDRSVPEDEWVDGTMNRLDKLHDRSHVRQYRAREWLRLLETSGFDVYAIEPYTQHRPLTSLTAGVGAAEVAEIRSIIDGLDPQQRAKLNLDLVGGEPHSDHWYVLLMAIPS
jgi:SAM-dependent methyltransferase